MIDERDIVNKGVRVHVAKMCLYTCIPLDSASDQGKSSRKSVHRNVGRKIVHYKSMVMSSSYSLTSTYHNDITCCMTCAVEQ